MILISQVKRHAFADIVPPCKAYQIESQEDLQNGVLTAVADAMLEAGIKSDINLAANVKYILDSWDIEKEHSRLIVLDDEASRWILLELRNAWSPEPINDPNIMA